MIVALKGAIVCKGIETADSCMSMATTNSALRWNFKNSATAKKRSCALLSIVFGVIDNSFLCIKLMPLL